MSWVKLFDRVRAWLFPKPLTSDADQEIQEMYRSLRKSLEIVDAYGGVLARGVSRTTLTINRSERDLPYSKQEIAQAIAIVQGALKEPALRTILIQVLSPKEVVGVLSPEYEIALGGCLVALDRFVPHAEFEVECKRWEETMNLLEKFDPSVQARTKHALATGRGNDMHIDEEIYTHEYLWRSASKLLEHAEVQGEAPPYLLLPALLVSYMAFEAFVNFCGFILLPELWKDEKKHFKGKGIDGKIEEIVKKLPTFEWEKGEPPYQRIKNLENFRDIVSHGKVVATQYVTEQKEDGSHFQFKHSWDAYLSVHAVNAARVDIKSFSQSLLIVLRQHSDHPHLIFDAFEGCLASGSGKSKHD